MLAVLSPTVIKLALQYRPEFLDFQQHQGKLMHTKTFSLKIQQHIQKNMNT
jgi:hypothetical protein